MIYDDWGRIVAERFPPRNQPEPEWELVRQQLAVGQTVEGTVVAKAPFGAWLDIGVGFPALLLIPDVEGLTAESYREDNWCGVGTAISVNVVSLNDPAFVVRVSHGKPYGSNANIT